MDVVLPTALNEIFTGLRSPESETKAIAGRQLAEYVTTAAAEDPDDYAKLWNEHLVPSITRLAQAQGQEAECVGALVAIDNIVQILLSEANEMVSVNLYRFYGLVKGLLPRQQAASSLGMIVRLGGAGFGDALIDYEVDLALDTVIRNEKSRQSALMVLSELARNSPGNFYKHMELVLERVWVPLRDMRLEVKHAAAELVAVCLDILFTRDSQISYPIAERLLRETLDALRATDSVTLVAGMFTYKELLKRGGMLLQHSYPEASENILRLRQHRDGMVRRVCIIILPELAAYDAESFTSKHMRNIITHLLMVTVKPTSPDERGLAFKMIGALAKALQTGIMVMMDKIVERIHEALTTYVKKTSPPVDPVFDCIKKLAKALGPLFARHAQSLLDVMFSHKLTEGLKRALDAIIHGVPALAPDIKERLLQLLTVTLCGRQYHPLGSPEAHTGISLPAEVKAMLERHGYETITLAIHILGTSDFAGHGLSEVVRVCIIPYLSDEHAILRQTAALSACTLIAVDPVCFQTSDYSVGILMDMLDRLLTLAVADQDPTVRRTVLGALDIRFDRHLAHNDCVRYLFMAANDEVFANRDLAVKHIGRLAALNPAFVMPLLRKTVIQLLNEVEYSIVSRRKEESAKLLTELITSTDTLITPYSIPILRCLLPLTRPQEKCTIEVGSAIMRCLCALAVVGGEHITEFTKEIMDLVVRTLSDPVATRQRRAALETLGAVCSSTGYLVDPEFEHPKLVDLITKVLVSEKDRETRREAMRALGILGAVDPYKHAHNLDQADQAAQDTANLNHIDLTAIAADTNKEEYSSTVVFSALVGILKTPSLSSHHPSAIDAIMSICKTQGLKILGYLPQVMPVFFHVIRTARSQTQVYHLQQLGLLVGILGQHTRNYLPEILKLIGELWGQSPLLEPFIIALIENLARGFAAEFHQYIPTIIGPMLHIFEHESPEKSQAALTRALQAIVVLAPGVDPALVLPVMLRTAERADAPTTLRRAAITAVSRLAERCDLADHASRIIHPLLRILSHSGNDLRIAVMDAICTLMQIFGPDFVVLVPTIDKCLQANRIIHPPYTNLAQKMLKNIPIPLYIPSDYLMDRLEPVAEAAPLDVNQQHLRSAWDTSQISTGEDWREWIRRFAIECLKESPSHALRSCRILADSYMPLLKELFSISFFRCYFSLAEDLRDELDRVLEYALIDPRSPADVCHMILNAAEFMEHDDKPLPLPLHVLSECALRTHAYAKALHWRELDFLSGSSSSGAVVESLIFINTRLGQSDAAYGTLTAARDQPEFVEHEQWYERLGKWGEAYALYNHHRGAEAESPTVVLGKMRCLHALGEWRQLEEMSRREWTNATHSMRVQIAPLATAAAWSLQKWDSMAEYINTLDETTADCSFYKAVQAIHRDRFDRAQQHVDKAREQQDEELTALAEQNYGRSYSMVLRMQMLSEIEEMIKWKMSADNPERQNTIQKVWMHRLQQSQPEVEVWQRIVQLRTLVLIPKQDPTMWTKFANLCRKNGRSFLADRTFNSLLDERFWTSSAGGSVAPPSVIYSHLKFLWTGDHKLRTIQAMSRFIGDMSRDLGLDPDDPFAHIDELNTEPQLKDFSKLLAKCYLKRAEWMVELDPHWATNKPDVVLSGYDLATKIAPDWYKAWSTWASANHEVIALNESQTDQRTEEVSPTIIAYILGAMQGFFRSIELRKNTSLQDSLRLLTMWFKYGAHPDVHKDMAEGISALPADTWLEVIPQIIARIQTPSPLIRRLINNLLLGVGQAHPQALIYPLSVASRSTSMARKQAAMAILERMRTQNNILVEEALSVSQELIRVAILWPEMWHEGLEEASRLYFTERDPEGMIAVLEPLHAQLEKGANTTRERSFLQAFGEQLAQAREHTRAYQAYGNGRDLTAAWDVYYVVFKRIERQLAAMPVLDLQFASPILKRARNLRLAIPGSYVVGRPVVTIASFSPNLAIIASKQRPRRMTIFGSDGKEYQFGLKGHEDLRQDERAMQLFGLVNTLLSQDPDSFKRSLHILRYPIIPLAPNVGLMGWVQQTETLHVLIRDYRETRKILLNIEYRLMLQMAPDYECLTLIQKVEVFEYALDNTTGQDLYRILWLKSANSEEWLERRTTYTRSLAVSSMVGYILGLGDRHPSNLLIHRITGKVIHIDFGDCFEVAMNREKYPERVPFRLTRMLTKAMEVSGIKGQGSYRNTCVITMEVLRRNKDSLLAVLEAFVWDPLVNWRLMQLAAAAAAAGGGPSSIRGGQLRGGLPSTSNPEVGAQRTTIGAPSIPNRRVRADENDIFDERSGDIGPKQEIRDQRALAVYNRVRDKLTGRDFNTPEPLPTVDQVLRLIEQATSYENLCQSFSGWCAFW